jgi:soluble lytic murein transglycosylase-like protein
MYKNIYISSKTYECFVKTKEDSILRWGNKFKVSVPLIRAIISQESKGNFWATRYEHHLKKANWYQRALKGLDYIVDFHYCSFGLMQIMFATARSFGFMGSPFKLYNPEIGIKYGVKMLKSLMKRYKGRIHDVVAAYNQGNNRFYDVNKNGIKDKGENYYNQEYVDSVMKLYEENGGTV